MDGGRRPKSAYCTFSQVPQLHRISSSSSSSVQCQSSAISAGIVDAIKEVGPSTVSVWLDDWVSCHCSLIHFHRLAMKTVDSGYNNIIAILLPTKGREGFCDK